MDNLDVVKKVDAKSGLDLTFIPISGHFHNCIIVDANGK